MNFLLKIIGSRSKPSPLIDTVIGLILKLLVLLLVLELLVEMGVRCKGLGEIDCFVELDSLMSLVAGFLLFTDLFIWGFLLGLFLGD